MSLWETHALALAERHELERQTPTRIPRPNTANPDRCGDVPLNRVDLFPQMCTCNLDNHLTRKARHGLDSQNLSS